MTRMGTVVPTLYRGGPCDDLLKFTSLNWKRGSSSAMSRMCSCYGRSRQEAESLVAAIRGKGGDAEALGGDLCAPDDP
jgi:hypothetical protein